MTAPCLDVQDLHTFYGASHILQGVTFSVREGGTVAILGRNGAGKTTILRSIMNLVRPRSGDVRFRGTSLVGQSTAAIARRGMILVPENRGTFSSLTVRETLSVVEGRRPPGPWSRERLLALFPRLSERLDQRAGVLSGGEQQLLTIGRSLLLNPALLLLDEPTQGLAPRIVKELLSYLHTLQHEGLTMLLVEQNVAFATDIAQSAILLGRGVVQRSGTMQELAKDGALRSAWLGV